MNSTGSDLPDREGAGSMGQWAFGLEADELERPHVVVTLDTRSGAASLSGPYRTAIAALCAADVEYQVDRDQGGTGELRFHVAVLRTPVGPDDLDPSVGPPTAWAPSHRHLRDRPTLVRVAGLLTTVAQLALRRRPGLTAGAVAGTAAACLPAVGEGWARRGRTPRHRHLLGREAR